MDPVSTCIVLTYMTPRLIQTVVPELREASFDTRGSASRYTPLIASINQLLQSYAETQPHVTFQDCGQGLLQAAPEVSAPEC